MTKINIVWHRRDLRIHDNKALLNAVNDSIVSKIPIIPVFIIDPFFYKEDKLVCNDRILFIFECLEDLRKSYEKIGLDLHYYYGNSTEIILKLQKAYDAKVYYNQDSSCSYGFKRDKDVSTNLNFKAYTNDAIIRERNSGVNWAKNANIYFNSDLYDIDTNIKYLGIKQKKRVNLDKVKVKYNLDSSKKTKYKGGETEAFKRFDQFKNNNITFYPNSISKPQLSKINCSRLSSYFSVGALSTRYVFQKVSKLKLPYRTIEFYLTRLYWREHFTQKLQNFPASQDIAINSVLQIESEKNQEFIDAFYNAKTGFPIVDAAIICLKDTGWLNFRSRALLASFFSLILKQNWKIGADFMHRHLIDADIAINYQQWQMQSGLTQVHLLRIYNPTKMIEDHDPRYNFIKEHLPIFKSVNNFDHISEPSKYAYIMKEKYGIEIGKDYPKPIVNFELEARKTREELKKKTDLFKDKLKNPQISKRTSLSKNRKKIDSSKKTEKNMDRTLDSFF